MLKSSLQTKTILMGSIAFVITNTLIACTSVPSVKMVKRQDSNKTRSRSVASQQVKPLKASHAQAGMACDNQNMAQRSRDNNSKNDQTRILIVDEVNNSGIVVADIAIDCADYHANQQSGRTQSSSTVRRQIVNAAPAYPELDPNFTSVTTRVDYTKTVTKDAQPTLVDYPSNGLNQHDQTITRATLIPAHHTTDHGSVYTAPQQDQFVQQDRFMQHRVRRGDTVYSIARRYCVSQERIVDINNIDADYNIHPDQRLQIPADGCE